jgi:hypothetical protein
MKKKLKELKQEYPALKVVFVTLSLFCDIQRITEAARKLTNK